MELKSVEETNCAIPHRAFPFGQGFGIGLSGFTKGSPLLRKLGSNQGGDTIQRQESKISDLT